MEPPDAGQFCCWRSLSRPPTRAVCAYINPYFLFEVGLCDRMMALTPVFMRFWVAQSTLGGHGPNGWKAESAFPIHTAQDAGFLAFLYPVANADALKKSIGTIDL